MRMQTKGSSMIKLGAKWLPAAVVVVLLAGCGSGSGSAGSTGAPASVAASGNSSANAGAGTSAAADGMVQSIHDALPAKIRDAGKMTVVMNGTNLPYWESVPGKESEYSGAGADLMKAVGEVMGVEVDFVAIPDISGAIAAISTKRYAFAFAPYGDSVGGPKERPGVEFVDVVQEVVPFLVKTGNPKGVASLDTVCGIKLAAQVNGGAYDRAVAQADKCKAQGKNLEIVGVTGVPNGILAVRSGRADAFFSSGAALFYAAKSAKGQLEVVGQDSPNGFAGLFQGAVLPKGSDLTQPLLKSFQELFDNGSYAAIMKKWSLDNEMVDAPGVNLYAEWLKKNPS